MSLAAAYLFGTPRVLGAPCPDRDPRVEALQSDDPLASVEGELERVAEGARVFSGELESAYQSERAVRRARLFPPWLRLWSVGQGLVAGSLLLAVPSPALSPSEMVAGLLLVLSALTFLLSYVKRPDLLFALSALPVIAAAGSQVALLISAAWIGDAPSLAALFAPLVSLALLCGAPLPWGWSRQAFHILAAGSALGALLALPGSEAPASCLGMGVLCAVQNGVREHLGRLNREAFLLRRKVALQGERTKAERAAMERLAKMDALTGIANRRAFDARLIDHLMQARAERPVCVALLDIDYFKALNDAAGHLSGDECLRRVSAALRKAAGDAFVARYGGEEFAILFETGEGGAHLERLEHLREAILALRIAHPGRPGEQLTISIGGAMAVKAENSRLVLDRADTALYRAKAEGRNRVAFEPEAGPRPADTVDLRRLLDLAHLGREAAPAVANERRNRA